MRDKKARNAKIKARATIICLRSGRVLLVRKKSGKWNFPGGVIEPGESPIAAATRELQEETAIAGHSLLPLCTVQVGLTVHHVFTTHFDDEERPKARNEIVACKWVLRDNLSSEMLNPTAAGLLSRQLPALYPSA
ncbi:NUDIX hydrolase [Pseudomonas sp. NPDC089996]|uniref:NUDIX hydrolase n=1 Tax=Pseudomonas sp. NPDC089996 TaxID=3364474 RepID=UPI0037FFF9D5